MIAAREQEPEINIYATGEKFDYGKRTHANQTANGKPSKKPKVTSPRNSKPPPPKEGNAEISSERRKQSDVSYKHLFNFANATEQNKPSLLGKSTPSAFTFLDGDEKIDTTERGQVATGFRFLEDDGTSNLNEFEAQHSPNNFEHDMEIDQPSESTFPTAYRDRRRAGNGHMDTGRSRKFTSQRNNQQRNDEFKTAMTQTADVLMIPEDVEYRPDEILRIATRFCRQKSVEELEEEWCAPGGIRETMKRDFKQKRQNITRGRKLGSSNKR